MSRSGFGAELEYNISNQGIQFRFRAQRFQTVIVQKKVVLFNFQPTPLNEIHWLNCQLLCDCIRILQPRKGFIVQSILFFIVAHVPKDLDQPRVPCILVGPLKLPLRQQKCLERTDSDYPLEDPQQYAVIRIILFLPQRPFKATLSTCTINALVYMLNCSRSQAHPPIVPITTTPVQLQVSVR